MHPFRCSHCQHTVFFENSDCGQCGAVLGYLPSQRRMQACEPAAGADPLQPWQARGDAGAAALWPCQNRLAHANCNWMREDDHPLCASCRLTRVIPDLGAPRNRARWAVIEQAKRRLVFTLLSIGLAPQPSAGPDDPLGLAFDLLQSQPGQAPVRTGHERGTITLDIAEADDDQREAVRVRMGEPQRTLLGHLRHETAHYLQYRHLQGSPATEAWRAAFGDERQDYATALQRHYADGPPADWAQHHVSAYASAHPWEDWAETCAHYLLVLDAVETAAAWGLSLDGPALALAQPMDPGAPPAVQDLVLTRWLPVAQFLNAMHRSLGLHDSYPYLLPPAVLAKMDTVQRLLQAAAAAPG